MQKLLSLLLVSCLTFNVFAADCPKNVQRIPYGSVAACDGWLVSEPHMQKLTRTDEELEKTKKLVQAQELLQKLTAEEVEHYKQQSKSHQQELRKAEQKHFWVGVGAFALGVVMTGIAAKAAIESTR
jgi:hypothetical protein